MKLFGTTIKAVAIGAVAGIVGTCAMLVPTGALGFGALPGGDGSAAAATFVLAAGSAGHAGHASANAQAEPGKVRYVCPMGDFEGDRPGRCPKCGMKLVEKKVVAAPAPAGGATGSMAAGHKCDHGTAARQKCDHAKAAGDTSDHATAAGHKCDHAMAAGHKCDHAKAAAGTSDQTMAAGHMCNHSEGASGATSSVGADQKVSPASTKATAPTAEAAVRYACPMGCYTGDKPGTCPKCGMKLVKQK